MKRVLTLPLKLGAFALVLKKSLTAKIFQVPKPLFCGAYFHTLIIKAREDFYLVYARLLNCYISNLE